MVADSIITALRGALGNGIFALHEPRFTEKEQHYVQKCIASTYVSSVGAYVDRFEKELAAYTGVRRAVAVVNGTAALQVAVQIAGVQANDEVIVPVLTFVATANAVQYLGAVPHFADIKESTLGLDPRALRDWLKSVAEPAGDAYRNRQSGRRLGALVPMHTFGHPCDLEGLLAVAHDYRLQTLVLSDAVGDQRDAILQATNEAGLMTRPAWRLMHQLAPHQECPKAPLPVAESLAQRLINLPSSAGLA